MNMMRWYYFLSLEKDFIETIEYVEVDYVNKNTFSNKYAKILLLCGSEVDVVGKMVCKKLEKNPNNIYRYMEILTQNYPGIHELSIDIPRYNMHRQPWLSWGAPTQESPDWWKAYNHVKHDRDAKFGEANQDNALSALCGLLVLLLYLYKEHSHLQPYPELLDCGFPGNLVVGSARKLPGTWCLTLSRRVGEKSRRHAFQLDRMSALSRAD